MIQISMSDGKLFSRLDNENVSHVHHLVKNLRLLNSKETDVTIHCKNNQKVFTNKVVLSRASTMMKNILDLNGCNCTSFVSINFDLICPDFSAEAVTSVLQILVTGEASVSFGPVVNELKIIIKTFQIDITNISCALNTVAGHPETGQANSRLSKGPILSIPQDSIQDSTVMMRPVKVEPDMITIPDSPGKERPSSFCYEAPMYLQKDQDPLQHEKHSAEGSTAAEVSASRNASSTPFRCSKCIKTFLVWEAFEKHNNKHKLVANRAMKAKLIKKPKDGVHLGSVSDHKTDPEMTESMSENLDSTLDDGSLSGSFKEETKASLTQCPLCHHKSLKEHNLICHILYAHYQDRLREHMVNSIDLRKRCKLCSRIIKGDTGMFYHLFSVHGILREEVRKVGVLPNRIYNRYGRKEKKEKRLGLRSLKHWQESDRMRIKEERADSDEKSEQEITEIFMTKTVEERNQRVENKIEGDKNQMETEVGWNGTETEENRKEAVRGKGKQTQNDRYQNGIESKNTKETETEREGNIKETEKTENEKGTSIYECKICGSIQNASKRTILSHIGMFHLYGQILQEYNSVDKMKCAICTFVPDSERRLVDHLAVDHELTAGFVAEKREEASKNPEAGLEMEAEECARQADAKGPLRSKTSSTLQQLPEDQTLGLESHCISKDAYKGRITQNRFEAPDGDVDDRCFDASSLPDPSLIVPEFFASVAMQDKIGIGAAEFRTLPELPGHKAPHIVRHNKRRPESNLSRDHDKVIKRS